MRLPRYFGLKGEHAPNHPAVEKNHNGRHGQQPHVVANDAADKMKCRQPVNHPAGSDVPCRPAAQPHTQSRNEVDLEKNFVGKFPVKIDQRKKQQVEGDRVGDEVFKAGVDEWRQHNAGQSLGAQREDARPCKVEIKQLFDQFDQPESKQKKEREQQAVLENFFFRLQVVSRLVVRVIVEDAHPNRIKGYRKARSNFFIGSLKDITLLRLSGMAAKKRYLAGCFPCPFFAALATFAL